MNKVVLKKEAHGFCTKNVHGGRCSQVAKYRVDGNHLCTQHAALKLLSICDSLKEDVVVTHDDHS